MDDSHFTARGRDPLEAVTSQGRRPPGDVLVLGPRSPPGCLSPFLSHGEGSFLAISGVHHLESHHPCPGGCPRRWPSSQWKQKPLVAANQDTHSPCQHHSSRITQHPTRRVLKGPAITPTPPGAGRGAMGIIREEGDSPSLSPGKSPPPGGTCAEGLICTSSRSLCSIL